MNSKNGLKSIKSEHDVLHQAEKRPTFEKKPVPPSNSQDESSDELISKKVTVSVKKFVENTENDELTKLFRSMIGLDNKSSIVRQFSCKNCYRSWWRRVRGCKQVSVCIRCKMKYQAIPYEKEFGICEFNCSVCSSQFYRWCSKQGAIECKKCYNICKPVKVIVNNTQNKTQNDSYNHKASSHSCSSSSSSSSKSSNGSNSSNSSVVAIDGVSITNVQNEAAASIRLQSNFRSNFSPNRYIYYAQSSRYFCNYCSGTNLDLNTKPLVFRPQNSSPVYGYLLEPNYNQSKPGLSFCSYCRKIPIFSDRHISTGSTLASLSYQDELEIRLLDEEIESLEPCIEDQLNENLEENKI